jgi:hypothetical protein
MVVHLSFSFSTHNRAPEHAWRHGGCGVVLRRSTTNTANPLRRSMSSAATSLLTQLPTFLQPPVIAHAAGHPFSNLSWLPKLNASSCRTSQCWHTRRGKVVGGYAVGVGVYSNAVVGPLTHQRQHDSGNGYEYDFLSVTGNVHGFKYIVKVTDMDI